MPPDLGRGAMPRGVGRRLLHDRGADQIVGAAVHDVEQLLRLGGLAEHARRPVEQRALVERVDEGGDDPIFGRPGDPERDPVAIMDHRWSVQHRRLP